MNEIARILDQMDRAFGGEAWHGPALRKLLEGLSAEDASRHRIPGAHSVWELVNHIAAWNQIVSRRALGEKVDVTAEMDWPPVREISDAAWTQTQERLKESRRAQRSVVEQLSDNQLTRRVQGEQQTYSMYVMLHGLVQHDLYHAGQIAILKKAIPLEKKATA